MEPNKTMVIFGGNMEIAESESSKANFYRNEGWDVVLVSIGGYPGSDEGVPTNEISVIQDVNAVLKHLEARGVTTIGVHGFSIGGTLAMHATKMSQRVKFACVERSISNVHEAAANFVQNSRIPVPSWLVKGAMRTCFPVGQIVPGVKDANGNPYLTDGLDNVAKAAHFNGKLVVISGGKDDFMGSNVDENGQYAGNFSNEIYHAHQVAKTNSHKAANGVHIEIKSADHTSSLNFVSKSSHLTPGKYLINSAQTTSSLASTLSAELKKI